MAMFGKQLFRLLTLLAAASAAGACKVVVPSAVKDMSEIVVPSYESSRTGRFFGFVSLSDQSKMAVVLDLLPSATEGGASLVVRFLPGGFESPEVSSFYYPSVSISADGSLRVVTPSGVPGDDQGMVELSEASIGPQRLTAKVSFSTPHEGLRGYIDARRQPSDAEDRKSFAAALRNIGGNAQALDGIAGQYEATCNGTATAIQLEFSRWGRQGLSDDPGFLRDGLITGRMGIADVNACGVRPGDCAQTIFRSGSYDPFGGMLILKSGARNVQCQLNSGELTCDSCKLIRSGGVVRSVTPVMSLLGMHERMAETVFDTGAALDLESNPAALEAGYYGYLHQEGTGYYQPVSLNLSFDRASGQYLPVSALYFGPVENNEFIAYRFDPVAKRAGKAGMVLSGQGEAFMLVTQVGSKGLNGIWYSKTHGRIGTVSLVRGNMPPLMADEKRLMPSLSGQYAGENWQFDLRVASNVSEDARDFYPLRMFGVARDLVDPSRRRLIQDGSFDFYTGQIALRLDDGRTIVGRMATTGFDLFWPAWTRTGVIGSGRELQAFKRSGHGDKTIAARKANNE
ncbi:MAG: hypothetical protein RIQ81_1308 [Pseudomonadota bacterium]|jgi:hypothetical protein